MPTHQRSLDLVSLSDLATLTRHDRRTIRKALAGVGPAKQDGRTIWYSAPIALAAIYADGGGLDPAAEKARLDAARADLAEQELRKRRGELLDAEDVRSTWSRRTLTWKERLRSLPAHATVHVPGFTKPMGRALLRLIDSTLGELADGTTRERRRRTSAPRRAG